MIPNTEGQVTIPVNPDHRLSQNHSVTTRVVLREVKREGALTFYYNNDQSARLMFYHDHSYGITRLNVYAGEAAGYLITDEIEQLIAGTNLSGVNPGLSSILPDVGIPLIIQDKTFVDEKTIAAQDPTWRWGTGTPDLSGRPAYKTGDLWVPHVFMTIPKPLGCNRGKCLWSLAVWPLVLRPPTQNILMGPQPNTYFDPTCDPALGWCEPAQQPASPDPSMGAKSFNDTMLVNGQTLFHM